MTANPAAAQIDHSAQTEPDDQAADRRTHHEGRHLGGDQHVGQPLRSAPSESRHHRDRSGIGGRTGRHRADGQADREPGPVEDHRDSAGGQQDGPDGRRPAEHIEPRQPIGQYPAAADSTTYGSIREARRAPATSRCRCRPTPQRAAPATASTSRWPPERARPAGGSPVARSPKPESQQHRRQRRESVEADGRIGRGVGPGRGKGDQSPSARVSGSRTGVFS